jgi:hypothetical protein
MTAVADRLQQAKARPLLIEGAVRTALRDAIAWRAGGGTAPGTGAFIAAAVASAPFAFDAAGNDTSERSRTLAAVQRAAKHFTRSALWRRLMTLPPSQFLRLPRETDGPDVIVRDRFRRVHAIVLSVRRDAFEFGGIATRIAVSTPLSVADHLTPLTVHVFSLTTGRRHTFERAASEGHPSQRAARVA